MLFITATLVTVLEFAHAATDQEAAASGLVLDLETGLAASDLEPAATGPEPTGTGPEPIASVPGAIASVPEPTASDQESALRGIAAASALSGSPGAAPAAASIPAEHTEAPADTEANPETASAKRSLKPARSSQPAVKSSRTVLRETKKEAESQPAVPKTRSRRSTERQTMTIPGTGGVKIRVLGAAGGVRAIPEVLPYKWDCFSGTPDAKAIAAKCGGACRHRPYNYKYNGRCVTEGAIDDIVPPDTLAQTEGYLNTEEHGAIKMPTRVLQLIKVGPDGPFTDCDTCHADTSAAVQPDMGLLGILTFGYAAKRFWNIAGDIAGGIMDGIKGGASDRKETPVESDEPINPKTITRRLLEPLLSEINASARKNVSKSPEPSE